MQPTESILTIRDCKLLMRRAGSGPPVLFLHGAGGSMGWLPFCEKMADQVDFMLPDHPSFGKSSTPEWLEEVADLAYFYLDLLAELNLTQVHVIGHSMGGWTALEMAIRSTERIKSMTLIAPAGIRIKGEPLANVFIMNPQQLMHALFADPKVIEQALAHTPAGEELDEMLRNQVSAARLGWSPRFFNPKLEKWLHRVKIPTQIIWGDKDGIISPIYAKRFAELIPQAAVTVVSGVGHVPQLEKSDEVATAIMNFIRRNG